MSAALIWALRAYVTFYAFVGLFIVVLMIAGLLRRLWSSLDDVPSRYNNSALVRVPPIAKDQ